jgi:hypothetical protein
MIGVLGVMEWCLGFDNLTTKITKNSDSKIILNFVLFVSFGVKSFFGYFAVNCLQILNASTVSPAKSSSRLSFCLIKPCS